MNTIRKFVTRKWLNTIVDQNYKRRPCIWTSVKPLKTNYVFLKVNAFLVYNVLFFWIITN